MPGNETENDNFVRCVMNIGKCGDTTGQDDQGRHGQKMNRADGGTATFVYEVNGDNEYEIVSVSPATELVVTTGKRAPIGRRR